MVMYPDEFRMIRKKLGLTQAELAHWLGYAGRGRIAEVEGGSKAIPPLLERLMRAYGAGYLPPEYFTPDHRKD